MVSSAVGTTGATGGMALDVATFFRFVARRLDSRPEDYEGVWKSEAAHEKRTKTRCA